MPCPETVLLSQNLIRSRAQHLNCTPGKSGESSDEDKLKHVKTSLERSLENRINRALVRLSQPCLQFCLGAGEPKSKPYLGT